jgi:hypothetical protein
MATTVHGTMTHGTRAHTRPQTRPLTMAGKSKSITSRSWPIPVPSGRGSGASRHVHAVQIAGLEQRVRHKQSMVRWLEMLSLFASIGAILGFLGCAAGAGAVVMSIHAQEPTLVGVLILVLTLAAAICCVLTRFIIANARRSLCKDIFEAVNERNRLQFVR